jgi:hypothetical protein
MFPKKKRNIRWCGNIQNSGELELDILPRLSLATPNHDLRSTSLPLFDYYAS